MIREKNQNEPSPLSEMLNNDELEQHDEPDQTWCSSVMINNVEDDLNQVITTKNQFRWLYVKTR